MQLEIVQTSPGRINIEASFNVGQVRLRYCDADQLKGTTRQLARCPALNDPPFTDQRSGLVHGICKNFSRSCFHERVGAIGQSLLDIGFEHQFYSLVGNACGTLEYVRNKVFHLTESAVRIKAVGFIRDGLNFTTLNDGNAALIEN
jgi:hypothetical protein